MPELRELVSRDPKDASAFHNLGTVQLQRREFDAAIQTLSTSIQLRPTFVPAHVNLGYALKESGDRQGALTAFKDALRLDPSNEAVSREIAELLNVPWTIP